MELEQIWNRQRVSDNERDWISREALRTFRKRYAMGIMLPKYRLLVFDSVYKAIVVLGYVCLFCIGELTLLKAGTTILISGAMGLLILKNFRLKKAIQNLDTSQDIIRTLKEQYRLLYRFYREFLPIGSMTNPFLVLAGFQYYHLLKYQEDGLVLLLHDPVIYIFLVLAFVVPFVVNKITYAAELKELEQLIDIGLDEVSKEIDLIRIKEKKRARRILFSLLVLIGLLTLLIILNAII
ncbi:MAG: hypothetical protein R3D58_21705 [Saprospiraceae bacterium]|nr:hypothetical protein [Lewinellaceae bacterium]